MLVFRQGPKEKTDSQVTNLSLAAGETIRSGHAGSLVLSWVVLLFVHFGLSV